MSQAEPEEILDAFGDEYVRQILRCLSEGPCSAKDIEKQCDISLPTIYRRLNQLVELSLVSETTETKSDGNKESIYKLDFDSAKISFDSPDKVTVTSRRDPQSEFVELWRSLSI
jgi:predicted transcriptional regulator